MLEDRKVAAPFQTASEKNDNKGDSSIDSTEKMMPNSSCTRFTFMLYVDLSKHAIGLTSVSGLTGFSLGWLLSAQELQTRLSSSIDRIVTRKVWEKVNVMVITGLVRTLVLGYSSYLTSCGQKKN